MHVLAIYDQLNMGIISDLQNNRQKQNLSSLDVEFLFTNEPVQ